jgi:hypothetical protein
MNKRLYPITENWFNTHINPLIINNYSRAGRPKTVSNYQVFMLRGTSCVLCFMCYERVLHGVTYQKIMVIGTRFTYASKRQVTEAFGGILSLNYNSLKR